MKKNITHALCIILSLILAGCMPQARNTVLLGQQALNQKKYALAFKYYQKAAKKGDPQAQYAIGYMYYHGFGVDKDLQYAIRWWGKSAKSNYKPAQNALAQLDQDIPFFQ